MKLAVYNVENLFDRAKAMNLDSWEEGRPVLERFAALSSLLGQIAYGAADKARMVELMIEFGLESPTPGASSSCAATAAGCCGGRRQGGW